jgi:sensor histidine kinase regulating citrate/malate metabolism
MPPGTRSAPLARTGPNPNPPGARRRLTCVRCRARIILLFAATLVLTLAVASYLGERVSTRAIEATLRERSVDLAKAVAEELDLSPNTEIEKAADALAEQLRPRRIVRFAELAIRRRGEVRVARVTFGPEGAEIEVETRAARAFPVETSVSLVDDGESRGWRVDLPLHEARTTFGSLRIETTLSGVEEIASTERRVFFLVAGVGAAVLAVAFTFLLGRMLVRPLSELAAAIEGVQSGAIDAEGVPGVDRTDEIGVLARGLRAMLGVMLNMKPIIQLKEGVLLPTEDRIRVRSKAFERIIELSKSKIGDKPAMISVVHAAAPEEAKTLADLARKSFNLKEEVLVQPLSIAVSIQLGPGTMGVVGYPV